MKRVRLHLLNIIVTTMTLLACNQEPAPLDPNRVDVYNHAYDNLKISEIEGKYSTHTYKDYSRYSMYTYLGYPSSYTPSVGNAKILVVPVWFNDSTEYIALDHRENVRDDIRKAYFGTEEETGWESVKTYYYKDSFGRLNIDGFVTDWYETNKNSSDYYSNYNSTQYLLYDVCNWAKENIEDYSSYDCDKDGFLDGLVLIYACYDQYGLYYVKNKNNVDNMWAYTSRLLDQNQRSLINPGVNDFFWASYDFLYGTKTEAQRAYVKERTGSGVYGTGDLTDCTVDSHTFIHETGHLFGLNDYYDYSGVASPALGFSMQDYNVGAHDPFSRFALGWAKAIIPTETCRIRVKPIEESGEFILLSPEFSGSAFGEYIALELFTPDGLNEHDCTYTYDGRPHPNIKYGVRMWHVDSRLYRVDRVNSWTGVPTKGHMADNMEEGSIIDATANSTYLVGSNNRAVNYAGSYDYKQLQVIRNGYEMYDEEGNLIEETTRRGYYITDDDFFQTGDYFTVHNYRSQFVEDEALNNGNELGWAIYFDEVSEEGMTVTCIKEFLKPQNKTTDAK